MMLEYNEALKKILEVAGNKTLGTERVTLEKAMGRILSEDIFSPEAVPSFDNSAMDGFSVLSRETLLATGEDPCVLSVSALIAAGPSTSYASRPQGNVPHCAEIMTGAPVPEEHDAVIRIEDVLLERNEEGVVTRIRIPRSVSKGENVRLRGTDFQVGAKVAFRGDRISASHILSFAALGITEVKVRKRPHFAVISTGSELVSSETKQLPHGMIRNSTGPYLDSLLSEMGVQVQSFGIVCDSPIEYADLLRRLLDESYDGVISTGGVSMGKYDFVSDVLEVLGAETHFHKVAIRPGKPILFAELKGSGKSLTFFGMPGNPVATAVGCRFFLAPYLRSIFGIGPETRISANLALGLKKPQGLRCFYKGRVTFEGGRLLVEALKSQASYVVSTLMESNCWVVFPENENQMKEGELVQVYPLTLFGGLV